ncbi:protein canopy homolog 2-like [Amphibalanus amphitrite]|uniref:protein canopy homolog 2-like n=1 Tax=Amphibalanus amphitrite TaxID=1232801 RepID=UPI001C91E805|nr:protein canopy homolog 2-like [Amphibalanus amphitrite]XP_043236934.1 protein canopy homolog 2-like [Amphibalanus amphitrite]
MLAISLLPVLLMVLSIQKGYAAFDDDLNCMVCEVIVNELEKGIAAVDPKKVIDLGGRLEADGSRKIIKKQYRRSEVHLGELLEGVCEKMDDYAQGHWKDTGAKDLLPIIVDGAMNPRMSEFELLQDSNLNRGIKDYCQTIVEEQEDELMAFLAKEHENASHQFCFHETSICSHHSHKEEL